MLEGCHSAYRGDAPRGGPSTIRLQEGWTEDGRRIVREHMTEWLPIRCGRDQAERMRVSGCAGCANQKEE